RIHDAAEEEVEDEHDEQDQPRAEALLGDEGGEELGQLRQGEEGVESGSAQHDQKQHGGGGGGAEHGGAEAAERESAAQQGHGAGADGADGSGVGGGEDAGIDAADDQQEQQHHGPDVEQRPEPFGIGGALAAGGGLRADAHVDGDGDDVTEQGEEAGHESGHEQLGDVLLGEQRVDDEDHRRRDEAAAGAAGGAGAGRAGAGR